MTSSTSGTPGAAVSLLPADLAPPDRCPVIEAPGALAAEGALLALLDRLLAQRGTRLDRPVRVVTASSSLRLHLLDRILRHRGRAVLGVVVQTVAGLAAEVLASSGRRRNLGDPLLPVLVQRRAAEQPSLADVLAPLDDGLAAAARPVADLLDAGFDAGRDAVPMAGLLQDLHASDAERLRALGLVQVTGQVQADLGELGLARATDTLRDAARLLHARPDLLPAQALLVHGLVDPDPAEQQLVAALVQRGDCRVILSLPRSQAVVTTGKQPVSALAQQLAGGRAVLALPAGGAPPDLDLSAAPGRRAEARHLARRLRTLLDQDQRPESVAVVVREISSWAGVLRPELERMGIPFSGVGAQAPAGQAQRKLQALLVLLSRGPRTPLDRWLDAVGRLPAMGPMGVEDLRLAMHSLGLVRLEELASLDLERVLAGRKSLPLPTRSGIVLLQSDDGDPDPDAEDQVVVTRRRLPGAALVAARDAAAGMLQGLGSGQRQGLRGWAALLRDLVSRHLGWGDPEAAWRALDSALAGLVDRVGVDIPLDEAELHLLLGPVLVGAAAGLLGGSGGGVQLLSAVEARGRSFDHLFLLGLSRGELPGGSRPDPLLTDQLRGALGDLLPALVTSASRRQVERGLFDHLLSTAPCVHLSWPATDDDGKVVPVSPLVEQLRLARPDLSVTRVAALGSLDSLDDEQLPLPAAEHALLAGLGGADDPRLRALWTQSLLAMGRDARQAPRVAAAMTAVRAELDAVPGSLGLGPYLGMVGASGDRDPRRREVAVTTLERMATCGWQAFLASVLRLEPPPLPGVSMPGVDARMVGLVVHDVLEQIVLDAVGQDRQELSLEQALALEPVTVPWPLGQALEAMIEKQARQVAAQEGLALPGLWIVLARRAAPYLDVARQLDWAEGPPSVLAPEVQAHVTLQTSSGPQRVAFRADRVDRGSEGQPLLTDYKTGRPLSSAKTPKTRDKHHLVALNQGRKLQAALYASSADGAVGRYLFLRPDVAEPDAPGRDARAPGELAGRDEYTQPLARIADAALGAWRQGGLVPRLVDDAGDTPTACSWCQLRPACLQGDSTARRRLGRWAQDAGTDPVGGDDEAAALRLWRLGQDPEPTE